MEPSSLSDPSGATTTRIAAFTLGGLVAGGLAIVAAGVRTPFELFHEAGIGGPLAALVAIMVAIAMGPLLGARLAASAPIAAGAALFPMVVGLAGAELGTKTACTALAVMGPGGGILGAVAFDEVMAARAIGAFLSAGVALGAAIGVAVASPDAPARRGTVLALLAAGALALGGSVEAGAITRTLGEIARVEPAARAATIDAIAPVLRLGTTAYAAGLALATALVLVPVAWGPRRGAAFAGAVVVALVAVVDALEVTSAAARLGAFARAAWQVSGEPVIPARAPRGEPAFGGLELTVRTGDAERPGHAPVALAVDVLARELAAVVDARGEGNDRFDSADASAAPADPLRRSVEGAPTLGVLVDARTGAPGLRTLLDGAERARVRSFDLIAACGAGAYEPRATTPLDRFDDLLPDGECSVRVALAAGLPAGLALASYPVVAVEDDATAASVIDSDARAAEDGREVILLARPLPRVTPAASTNPAIEALATGGAAQDAPQGGVAASGSLDRDVLARVFRRDAVPATRRCYERALREDPDVAGTIRIRTRIGPTGAVASAEVESSTTGHPALDACVARAVGDLEFPAPAGGEVVVVYPFTFMAN